jgi:hypothetical protein
LVISLTKFKVNKLSINPIVAKIKAYGKIISRVSIFIGTDGIENLGRPPFTLARSPTFGISILKTKTPLVWMVKF